MRPIDLYRTVSSEIVLYQIKRLKSFINYDYIEKFLVFYWAFSLLDAIFDNLEQYAF
jgi:hypothetical protein